MPLLLAQQSFVPGEISGWAVGLAGVVGLVLSLPLLLPRRTRWWGVGLLLLLWAGQAALLTLPDVAESYSEWGEELVFPWLLVLLSGLIVPGVLLLGRRTRRFGVALFGLNVIWAFTFNNYMATVVGSIGYLLLLLALWPCWRLIYGAPRGREAARVVPARGVLESRVWPVDDRASERGYNLASALVGVACLTLAFGLATGMISSTISAVRRAGHLAVATDLLESARERALLGAETSDLARRAAAVLPNGQASLQRTPAGRGLVRITVTATWREPAGKPGRATLEWLARERGR